MQSRRGSVLAILMLTTVSLAAAQIPSTDIFVLEVKGDSLGSPQRVTDRDSYDNQPRFLPDGKRLVYSAFGETDTDIVVYDAPILRYLVKQGSGDVVVLHDREYGDAL